MDEKRKFERFDISVPARIEIPTQEGQEKKLNLETDNLSAGGIFFRFGSPLPKNSQVKIEIVLHFEELKNQVDPEGTLMIAATGRVVRSGPEGTAIRFNQDYEISACLNFIQKGN